MSQFVRCNVGAAYEQNLICHNKVICWKLVCWSKHVCKRCDPTLSLKLLCTHKWGGHKRTKYPIHFSCKFNSQDICVTCMPKGNRMHSLYLLCSHMLKSIYEETEQQFPDSGLLSATLFLFLIHVCHFPPLCVCVCVWMMMPGEGSPVNNDFMYYYQASFQSFFLSSVETNSVKPVMWLTVCSFKWMQQDRLKIKDTGIL